MRGQRIVVIGAGYAGRSLVARLRVRAPQADVWLVEPGALVFERARLHEYIAGAGAPHRPLEQVSPRGVTHVRARAERVDLDRRAVWLEGHEQPLEYDWLALCAGARTRVEVPGALAPEDARLPALVQAEATAGGAVSVLGGGLSGVEIACAIAERHPRLSVSLTTRDALLPGLSPAAQAHARAVLTQRGVSLREHEAGAGGAGLVIAATGFVVDALPGLEGCARRPDGRLLVTDRLHLPARPEVMVIGDMAAVADGAGGYLRQSCAAAMPMGTWAGDALAARLAGQTPAPFSMRFEAICVGLGARDGVIDRVEAAGQAARPLLRGRAAAWAKDAILALTVRAPWAEARLGLPLYTWPAAAPRSQEEQADGRGVAAREL